ncbi:hypothetical protein ECZU26_16770 [Escherichia coli]|nr:hypothetical protein ECZU26_16770 [Escherichia coli]
MYVAVKGAKRRSTPPALQESRRRGNTDLPELSVAQIEQQLNLAVDRVMTEGGIADRELAALALKQASGDNVEAIFLLRAYRTTLAKLAVSEPLDTTEMRLERRISAVYKDIPGGQLLGPTYDYTHRLLDFTLLANGEAPTLTTADSAQQPSPHVFSLLARQGLAKFEEDSGAQPDDITRTPPVYPAHVLPVCSSSCAETKAICWRWPTPPNAVTDAIIRSQAKSAAAISTCRLCRKSWDLR